MSSPKIPGSAGPAAASRKGPKAPRVRQPDPPPSADPRDDEPTTDEPVLIELSQDGPTPRPPVALEITHSDFSDETTAPVNVTDFVPELLLDDSSEVEGEPSIEHVLELDEDGDSLASLTLEMEGESDRPADVVAAGGAIRVDLALGRPGIPEPEEVLAGVAVAPAAPIRSWPTRGGEPSEITTDLVALARITGSSGNLPEPAPPDPPAPPPPPENDDWLDEVEEDDTEDA